MKKILLFSLIALSSVAANAQVSAKDSIAAAKAAAKELKAKQAADLKAFKAKQAEDLKNFVAAQKGGTAKVTCSVPELKSKEDTVTYAFGVAQSRGLKNYMVNQLQVDTTYMAQFVDGIMKNASADPNDKELHAYSSGFSIGGQVVQMAQNFSKDYYAADPKKSADPKLVANGIINGLLDQTAVMSQDQAAQYFQKAMADQHAANTEALYGENRRAGEKFLEENKKKDGVVTLPSGLQYKVLVEGDKNSTKVSKTDKVKVNYEGHLIDGTEFDSSYKSNQPASFKANQVIKGWTEALTLMPIGAKWELYIPYQLAYGDRDQSKIKPYSALIFTVELLENETATEAAKKAADDKTTVKTADAKAKTTAKAKATTKK